MLKLTCLFLCVVAASFSNVYAKPDGNAFFREAAKPILMECSKESGVSIDELKAAKEAGSADSIKPCFFGCVYKKVGVINDKGEFDLDNALIKLKDFVSTDEDYNTFAEIGKKCVSVNEKPVSDGAAGCERGLLMTACFLEQKAEINDQGEYDLETGLKNLRQAVKDDVQYNNFADVAKKCASVNDEPVSDGTAGCERAGLMAACFLKHKDSIDI